MLKSTHFALLAASAVSAATGFMLLSASAAAAASQEDVTPASVQEILGSVEGSRTLTETETQTLESEGLSAAASSTCTSYKNAVAGLAWQTVTDFSCSWIGTQTGTFGYQWAKGVGTPANASVCIQGRGWRLVDSTKPWLGNQGYWRSGCGGTGSFTVDWQSAAGNPQIQHRIFVAPGIGLGFSWR